MRTGRVGTRTRARSWCAACSARCGWRVPAGGTAAAATSLPGPSSRWPGCCPSGPPRSWPTCRPASPPWSPTASPRTCWVSCCRWAGACTRPWYAARPRPWPSAWKTNSARNGPASSTPASVTARNYPARICRSWSGWTAATSTPASSGPAPTAGSRSSPARPSPPTGGPPASGTCRPTTPNPNGACSKCSNPRGWPPTSRSPSSPTAARTSATCPATSTPRPSTCWTGST